MQAQLTQLEADYGIEWQNFRIAELFSKVKVKPLKYRTSELPNTPKDNFILPALTAGIQNQGLNNYVPKGEATILKNVISISANGANTGVTFYQSQEFTVLQDAYVIEWCFGNKKLTENQYLYLVSAITKTIFGNYEWTNKAGWERIKQDQIQLPISNGKIAFDFMEAFIATLKAERLATLKAYLTVTGLTDTTLTPAEQTALDSLDALAWGTFKIRDMFENIIQGRRLKKQDQTSGALPFVMAGVTNTGVVNYIGNDTRVFPKNSLTVDIFGNVFYRSYEYGMGDDTGAYWNEDNKIPKLAMLYIATIMQKYMAGKFDYGHKLRSSRSLDFRIQIPITKEGIPDYYTMSLVVSALQKVVIQGVVSYLDARIETTAELV